MDRFGGVTHWKFGEKVWCGESCKKNSSQSWKIMNSIDYFAKVYKGTTLIHRNTHKQLWAISFRINNSLTLVEGGMILAFYDKGCYKLLLWLFKKKVK